MRFFTSRVLSDTGKRKAEFNTFFTVLVKKTSLFAHGSITEKLGKKITYILREKRNLERRKGHTGLNKRLSRTWEWEPLTILNNWLSIAGEGKTSALFVGNWI